MRLHRRELLGGAAFLFIGGASGARAQWLPWRPEAGSPPTPFIKVPWIFFDPAEGAGVEALVDRLIPPDPDTPGGKDAGCAVFIDRQLAGAYGGAAGLYWSPTFLPAIPEQGLQGPLTPAQLYRRMLAALDQYCHTTYTGKTFAELPDGEKDSIIAGMENGSLQLQGKDAKPFIDALLHDTRQGFFADPLYGGNRDMAAWKMIGFPGTRYDYRDWVEHHNETYPLPPVSIMGRSDWTVGEH